MASLFYKSLLFAMHFSQSQTISGNQIMLNSDQKPVSAPPALTTFTQNIYSNYWRSFVHSYYIHNTALTGVLSIYQFIYFDLSDISGKRYVKSLHRLVCSKRFPASIYSKPSREQLDSRHENQGWMLKAKILRWPMS